MQLRHLATRTASVAPASERAHTSAAPAQGGSLLANGPDPSVILSSIGELLYDWDLVTDRLTWGSNLEEALGPVASGDISTGLAYGQRLAPESASSRYDAIVDSKMKDDGSGVAYQTVYALAPPGETGGGPAIWIEDCGRWFADANGNPARAHGAVRVITERHERERLLMRGAQFDSLTGAPSRAHFAEHVRRLLAQTERNREPCALMLVALENLFALNRIYGYEAGDQLIAELAARLRCNVRVSDLVARHAGNKFALVLECCDAERLKAVAHRLLAVVAANPFETSAGAIPAGVRIGGVVAQRDGQPLHILLQHAEEALDFARNRNGARFVPHTASLMREDQRVRALKLTDDLVSALSANRIELAFQPVIHSVTGKTAFHEALLRVRLADGSIIVPGAIIPVAEKSGLMRLLDQRVLELALERLVADEELRISVNASGVTVHDPEWQDWLTGALASRPEVADRLIIEITETSMIEDLDVTRNLIRTCKRLGVKMAMDDFGAGHTSFRNLRELAFDLVKIDGVFVRNIVNSGDDRFFVRTLISLARHLGLEIVAEWVEDVETAQMLREWDVHYLQGAHFGSAAPTLTFPSPSFAATAS